MFGAAVTRSTASLDEHTCACSLHLYRSFKGKEEIPVFPERGRFVQYNSLFSFSYCGNVWIVLHCALHPYWRQGTANRRHVSSRCHSFAILLEWLVILQLFFETHRSV
jgi:hypothetical protein